MQIPEALKKLWEWVIMDFVGALLRSSKETMGKTYDIIMVMVDRLIKYAYFKPTNTNAIIPETAKVFMEQVIL